MAKAKLVAGLLGTAKMGAQVCKGDREVMHSVSVLMIFFLFPGANSAIADEGAVGGVTALQEGLDCAQGKSLCWFRETRTNIICFFLLTEKPVRGPAQGDHG